MCIRLVSESRTHRFPILATSIIVTVGAIDLLHAIARCRHHSILDRRSLAPRCTDCLPQTGCQSAAQLAPLLPNFLAAFLGHRGQVDQQSLYPSEQPP